MNTTIAAIATGQAPGGIGVIRISGPEAIPIASAVFCCASQKDLQSLPGYRAAYGQILSENGEKLDDCVALVFRGPKSYTGEDVVELSCHGGLFITRQVLARVLEAGARLAGPGEFTRRAFLNGKMDLAQAESVMALIGAKGEQAARMARAGGSGALSRRVQEICGELEKIAAHLAAWADFPEEDVEAVESARLAAGLKNCLDQLERLLVGFRRGKLYREGLRTVIAGRPNVGKSTLMNLLSGHNRSIVTPIPGTTRDVVEEPAVLAGVPLLLADTAGLRETADPVEQIGVASARERIQAAQLVLAVFDWSQELEEEDFLLMESLREVPAIGIINKSDLPGRLDMDRIYENFSHVVTVSASEGLGLEELEKEFSAFLQDFDPEEGELFTDRQQEAASRAKGALEEASTALCQGMTLDAVTVCVEDALRALLELTGKQVSEEVVERVFEEFCVGK